MVPPEITVDAGHRLRPGRALCGAAWRLRAAARATSQRAVGLWSLAFAATAAGSFAGGTYHGFATVLPGHLARGLWTVTTIVVGLAACLLLSATLTAAVPPDRAPRGFCSPSGGSSRSTPRGCSGTTRS